MSKLKMSFKLIVVGLCLTLTIISANEKVDQILNFFECDAILKSWIENSTKAIFDVENSTLTVDLTTLQEKLWEKDCSNYNHLWLELWWVSESPNRPENFGTLSYFSKYERCNQLEPEHFVFHSTKPLVAIENLKEDGREQIQFNHIVEHEYVLRVCPCGGGWQKSRKRFEKICDCKNEFYGRPHCSPLVHLDLDPDDIVYPWCQQQTVKYGDENSVATPRPIIHSPVVNCTSVLFSGVMASCTPLKTYDRVKLTLFRVLNEDLQDNKSAFRCNQQFHFGHEDPVSVETELHNFNESHGEFSVYLVNLDPEAMYCLQMELVDHPYCNPHSMTVGHLGGWKTPAVCISHVAQPIVTPTCRKTSGQGQVVPQSGKTTYFFTAMALLLAAWFGIVAMCILICCVKRKTASLSRKEQELKEKHRSHAASSRPSANSSCVDDVEESGNELAGQDGDVFLLTLPAAVGSNGSKGEDVHAMFRHWIQSVGCRVHDISDPEQDELINPDPEGWVLEILTDPNVKVVVVENIEDRVFHHPALTSTFPSEKTRDVTPLIDTSTSVDSIESTLHKLSDDKVDTDSNGYVRVAYHNHSSLKKLIATDDNDSEYTYASSRVLKLAACSTASTDLARSATSSLPSSLDKSEDFLGETDHLLLEDSRHDLRLFAWRFIQNHFVGKYNRVLFVRYSSLQSHDTADIVNSVTPQRQSLVIPYHLQEIKKWLKPESSSNRRSRRNRLSKENAKSVELCEKRLNASLLMSQYDCI